MGERLKSPLAYRIVIGVLAAVAVAAVTHLAVATARNGCVFADGDSYCRMARGATGDAPFSRRVLVPSLVGVLPHSWSIAVRFEIISVLGALAGTFGTFALTLRIVPARADTAQRRMVAATAAGALVAVFATHFRLAFGVPILVDLPATRLGVVWCLLLLSRRPWLRVLGALSPSR